jgi:TRAP-type C4-dicarboxylate transport system substrate-binding protein
MRDQVRGHRWGRSRIQQPAATISLFVPKFMVLDLPFLWTTEESMGRFLMDPWVQELHASLRPRVLKGVDFWGSGFKILPPGKAGPNAGRPQGDEDPCDAVRPAFGQYEAWAPAHAD